jgi:tetratricopeptide (TPR) repeat protein
MERLIPSSDSLLAELGIDPAELKSIKPNWKRTQYRAIINWLTRYYPENTDSNIEKVKGLLESFYHLCEIQEWQIASKIFLLSLTTPSQQTLVHQLDVWGYYKDSIDICNKILGKAGETTDLVCLNAIGNAHLDNANYSAAMEAYKYSLEIAQSLGNLVETSRALNNIGLVNYYLDNYSSAVKYYHKSIEFSRNAKDIEGESHAIGNLGYEIPPL